MRISRRRFDASTPTSQAATPTSAQITYVAPQGLFGRGRKKTKPGRWMQLVEISPYMWSTREIPQELVWNILVLIPKSNTGTQGIAILEMLWKVMETIINIRLRASIW